MQTHNSKNSRAAGLKLKRFKGILSSDPINHAPAFAKDKDKQDVISVGLTDFCRKIKGVEVY